MVYIYSMVYITLWCTLLYGVCVCVSLIVDLFGKKDPSNSGRANFNVEEVRSVIFQLAVNVSRVFWGLVYYK